VLRFCRAGQRGDAGELPRFAPRKVKSVTVDRLWLEDRGGEALLLTQISREARRLAGQWQLPEWNDLAGVLKLEGPDVRLKAQRTRGIANECIIERIWEPIKKPAADALGRIGNNPGGVKHLWLPWQALAEITLSGPHRRWINELKAF
jgi:A/G-specific adenine glycosylase